MFRETLDATWPPMASMRSFASSRESVARVPVMTNVFPVRSVAPAGFDVHQKTQRQSRLVGERPQREGLLLPEQSRSLTERDEDGRGRSGWRTMLH